MSTEMQFKAGAEAPDFTLNDQDGRPVSLSDFRGKKVILFAYPAAMTPGCTTQACDFRDSVEPLANAGYTVLGISPDAPEKQKQFAERDSLSFTLLSDPDKKVLQNYAAYGEKNMYGRVTQGVIRSTFVINEDGVFEHVLYNVKATGHVARVRKLVGA